MPTAFLTTKFFIPPPNTQRVARPRLMRFLDESLSRKLTLVSAPAGFGKTVLLGDWSREVRSMEAGRPAAPVAWVTLDDGDNDPMRFWGYVLTALDRLPALAGAATAALALAQDTSAAGIEPVLTALVNAVAERETLPHFVLVLDDYHTLTAPQVHDSLAFLLEHLPPTMHVMILSRADPLLPLARLRARGQLLELRAQDLHFNLAESTTFLNQVMKLNLSESEVTALDVHTEGWITGLQLAALSMQARADPHTFIRDFSGTNQFVLEFLTEEVLRHHPESVRQFLERSAILGRLCASLCEAVTDWPQSADMLTYLHHHNLFVEPLDDVGEWYRLHPLLAEALLAQLRKTQPDLIPVLHERARDWHAQQRHVHAAMRHALANGDMAWAADLVEREYRHLLAIGEMMTLRHWLEALPEAVIQARPKTHLAFAWGLGYSGHYGELERHLQQAEAALTEGENALRGEILALRAIAGALRGVAPQITMATAQQALTFVNEQDPLPYAMAHQALGHAHRMLGKPILAEREYNIALASGPASSKLTVLGALLRVGQVQVARGHLLAGAQSFRKHIELASSYGGQVRLYAGEALIRLGDLYREWNELDTALAHVQEGLDLAQGVENALALLNGYFTLAHVYAARGDHQAAQTTLQHIEEKAGHYDFQGLAERLALHRACLALVAGRMEEANHWAEGYAAQRLPDSAAVTDFQDLVLAHIWLKSGRVLEAQSLLDKLNDSAETAGRVWTVLQASTLRALAAQTRGDTRQARAILAQVLARAAPEGYIRLFVDEGPAMQALLVEQTPALGNSDDPVRTYLKRLLAAFGSTPEPCNRNLTFTDHLIEPLSLREQEVLRLMADGATNQAIAGTLVISVGTVKSHINRILGKLGAHNRTEAVVRAQTLHLL